MDNAHIHPQQILQRQIPSIPISRHLVVDGRISRPEEDADAGLAPYAYSDIIFPHTIFGPRLNQNHYGRDSKKKKRKKLCSPAISHPGWPPHIKQLRCTLLAASLTSPKDATSASANGPFGAPGGRFLMPNHSSITIARVQESIACLPSTNLP